MGKIKEKKHSYHLSAPKSSLDSLTVVDFPSQLENNNILDNLNFEVHSLIPSDVFKNVTIAPNALKQKLPVYSDKDTFNTKVTALIKSEEYCGQSADYLRKNTKSYTCSESKQRRKRLFSQVISSLCDYQKKREEEEKKKKKAILGNYCALKEALPVLDNLIKESKANQDVKPRVAKCSSKQDAEMMEDIQTFHQVLNDSQYASDPFAAISAQIQQNLQS